MRRRPADPERTRSVLLFCAALSFALAVLLVAARSSSRWGSSSSARTPRRRASPGRSRRCWSRSSSRRSVVACLRLAQDDGRGTWCSECVARNPEGATTCELAEPALADARRRGGRTPLRIERVGFGHPDAVRLIEEVQAEYVVRYGGPDDTPLDPAMFEPPGGSFFVGYLDDVPVATGAWRARSDVEALGTHRTAEIKRMYVAPEVRGAGHARRMLAHLEQTAAAARRRGDDPGDRAGPAGGHRALPVVGLHADPAVRLLQVSHPTVRCFAKRLG